MKSQHRTWRAILILLFLTFALSVQLTAGLATDRAVVEKMFEMYELDSTSYEIEILTNHLKSADVSADQLQLRPLSPKEPLGSFTVEAAVYDGNREIESAPVRMNIRRYADVAIAIDRLNRHTELTEAHVELRRMDVTNLRERAVTSFDELTNRRARRNLMKGSIITSGDVEAIPDIDIGREVRIVYIDGALKVSVPGIAMQAGAAGDYIRIRNKTSGKVIMARVVDDAAVSVDP